MRISLPNSVWLLTAGAFFAFFVFGFSDNLKGPVLPALLDDVKISYASGGTILMGLYLGFMVATLVTGFMADAFGHKWVLVLAGVALAVGAFGFSNAGTTLWLSVWMVVLGFGLGSIELGGNALVVLLRPVGTARYLNLMAVMHGLGAMIAPLFVGWLLSGGTSWRTVYLWDLGLACGLIVLFLTARFPRRDAAHQPKVDLKQLSLTAFSPRILPFYFALLIYVAIELGIASWMVEYLQKIRGQSVNESTQALSVFFGFVMVGRFVGSFVVERAGYLRSVLAAALAASACVAGALYGPAEVWWLLPGSGLFLSIIFPTVTAEVSSTHSGNLNTILGMLFTFAGLGGILGPWLIGIASDVVGLQMGFSLNLVFGLLTAVSAGWLLRAKTRRTI